MFETRAVRWTLSIAGFMLVAMTMEAQSDPFAPTSRSGTFIHVSGTRATDAAGKLVAGDIKAQTQRTLENVDARLKAAGSSLAMAASINVYLKNAADFAAMNEVYRTFWPKDPPVRTTIVANGSDPEALVEIAAVAIPNGGARKIIHPEGWVASLNPYSYGVLSGDTLFLSGLISRSGKDNQPVPGDMKAQTTTVLENAAAILKAAGMTHADVVQSRIYITDTAAFQDMNAAYRGFFPKDPPVRATVKAGLMGAQYLVEITMVAIKGARQVITPANADGTPGTPNPNLSSVIRAGDRLWLSGMLGNTPATKDDVAAQTKETLERLQRAAQAAGFDWAQMKEGVVYITDMKNRAAVEKAWREAFPKGLPAGVQVETGLVAPDGLVEIMLSGAK